VSAPSADGAPSRAPAPAGADEAKLLAYREAFPSLTKGVHLISHSLGAMPRAAREAALQYHEEWEEMANTAWHVWLPRVTEVANVIARVLGVDDGTVSIHNNVSSVQAAVASCFTFEGPRNKIVYDELNFSTVHYVWREQTRRGAEVCVVRGRDGIHAPIDELLAAIDERTLLVPISHVLFRSSGLYDAKRVIDRAHEVGAMVLLDCYQSAGTVPLALKEWGCDMACGGSVKWACGGAGCAYLYTRPDLAKTLKPAATGWFSHAEPFAFDMGPMRYADDAWRMVGGTPAMPAVYAASAGWKLLAEIGVDGIRKKSLRQTALLRSLVEERGLTVNTPAGDDERGGTICFDFDGSQAVSQAMAKRRFFHDYRPQCGLRVSPHYYTTDDELRAFMAALDEVRAEGGALPVARGGY